MSLFGAALEPFRLACPHCSSKVVVRHAQLLGKVLPCPKCKESIVVPSESPAPSAAKGPSGAKGVPSGAAPQQVNVPIVNSAAITKVGDPDWDELLANESFATPADVEQDANVRFHTTVESNRNVVPMPSPFQATSKPLVESPLEKQAAKAREAAKRRQWIILGSIGAAGSLVAIGLFVAFINMVGSKDKDLIAKDDPVLKPLKEPAPVDVPNGEASGDNQAKPTVPDPTKPEMAQPDKTGETEDKEKTNDEAGPAEIPSDISMPSSETNPSDTTPDTNKGATENPKPNPSTMEKPPEDANTLEAPSSIMSELDKWFQRDTMPAPKLEDKDIISELDIQNEEIPKGHEFHPLPQAVPSWSEKAKLPITSFKVANTTMLRTIDLFGRMTGVGITVDWQSCRIAGVDLTKPIQFDEQNKSIDELMIGLLDRHGLTWSVDAQGLPVVSASGESLKAKLPTDWSVQGLFPEGFEQQGVEALLKLWECDDVCNFVDGRLEWEDQATAIVKANVQSSLYELAALKQLPANNLWHRPVPSSATFVTSEWHRSKGLLSNTVPLSIITPDARPIAELLSTTASETEANLIIDWQNVWSHGLTPGKTAVSVLRGRSLPQVARRFLNDYALEMVPISGDTFWITVPSVRRKLVRVVPIRMPQNSKIEDLKQTLRVLAPIGTDERSRFKILPIPGTEDLYYARICSPTVDQLSDTDVVFGLSWPNQ